MVLDFDNLRLLVANGGGVTVDASKYTVQQLTLLAAHAAASGAQLTVEGFSGLSSDDLRTIAANGKGKVIFSGTVFLVGNGGYADVVAAGEFVEGR